MSDERDFDPKYYNDFDTEFVEKCLVEMFGRGLDNTNERKMIFHGGKGAAIMQIEAFERACGRSEEDIQKIIEDAKETLKEGIYRFDSTSLNLFEYLGKL